MFGILFWLVVPEPRQAQPHRIRDVLPMLKDSYSLFFRATFAALQNQSSPKSVAQRRGKKVADLLSRGGSSEAEAEADAAAVVE